VAGSSGQSLKGSQVREWIGVGGWRLRTRRPWWENLEADVIGFGRIRGATARREGGTNKPPTTGHEDAEGQGNPMRGMWTPVTTRLAWLVRPVSLQQDAPLNP